MMSIVLRYFSLLITPKFPCVITFVSGSITELGKPFCQKQRVNYFEIENFIEFVRKKFYKVFFA